MSPESIFRSHLVLGYVAWLLCFTVYVWPRLKSMNPFDAQRAIATLHSFRFFGLVFMLPGVVSPDLPASFAVPTAYGDLATGVLAMLADFDAGDAVVDTNDPLHMCVEEKLDTGFSAAFGQFGGKALGIAAFVSGTEHAAHQAGFHVREAGFGIHAFARGEHAGTDAELLQDLLLDLPVAIVLLGEIQVQHSARKMIVFQSGGLAQCAQATAAIGGEMGDGQRVAVGA